MAELNESGSADDYDAHGQTTQAGGLMKSAAAR